MKNCVDEKIGIFLLPYEMGRLDEKKRTLFERHLTECEYCQHELQKRSSVFRVFHQQRQKIAKQLQEKGITFESAKDELFKQAKQRTLFQKISDFLLGLFEIKIFIPAVSAVCIALLILLFKPFSDLEHPYISHLVFEKLPYDQEVTRGPSGEEARILFNTAMSHYQKNEFEEAVHLYRQIVDVDSTQLETWMYLGVCCYMLRKPDEGIEALLKAQVIQDPVEKNHVLWYLAQSYILAGDPDAGVPLLERLYYLGLEHSEDAGRILKEIH